MSYNFQTLLRKIEKWPLQSTDQMKFVIENEQWLLSPERSFSTEFFSTDIEKKNQITSL